jgi:hypothetical protein
MKVLSFIFSMPHDSQLIEDMDSLDRPVDLRIEIVTL